MLLVTTSLVMRRVLEERGRVLVVLVGVEVRVGVGVVGVVGVLGVVGAHQKNFLVAC